MVKTNVILSCSTFLALMLPPSACVMAQSFHWKVVVNNAVTVPGDSRTFNSYSQPSVNVNEFVVFRARSKGGTTGEPAHGVFTRDMAQNGIVLTRFDRTTLVPPPNNLLSTFVEPPAFPRIDMFSNTFASRGNHQPVWNYLLADGTETRAGTTGIYTDPFGFLITGASNLGSVSEFGFFAVPMQSTSLAGTMGFGFAAVSPTPIKFDVFPGAPAVTDGSTIVFKGNYSVPDPNNTGALLSKTGVYFRNLTNGVIPLPGGQSLAPAGGINPVVLIANSDTVIPGTDVRFGSTAPPSAARNQAVFAGFDNEDNPTKGGIYLAALTGSSPRLTGLVQIGDAVPGESKGSVFNKLGEGVSFDGQFVAFWGAWGTETISLTLQCPTDGNKDVIAYCARQYPNGFPATIPQHQGIFVHNNKTGQVKVVAKSPTDFSDFVYWNFSGLVPGTGNSDETGEPARWRSASFVAVSGLSKEEEDSTYTAAFKARTGSVSQGAYVSPVDGVYLRKGPGKSPITTVVKTGMAGTTFDPEAIDPLTKVQLPVTAMGIERDGLRGKWLAISLSMGTEEAGWAGVYLSAIPDDDD